MSKSQGPAFAKATAGKQNKKIEGIRHSLAHIMAAAVQELYPGVKFGIGPAIENGFYYDFDFTEVNAKETQNKRRKTDAKQKEASIGEDNLPKIEKKMWGLIKKNLRFKKREISKREAKKLFKDQPYKLELIKEIKGTKVSIYQSGDFIDLCKGPHVKSTREINPKAFKLTKIAGAYWRGNEKNPMLTRIYGVAFETEKELKDHLKQMQEVEKRDHRILGEKLDLFHIADKIGTGLILWQPKGAIMKKIIEDYALSEYLRSGYQLVNTPHIAKLSLWKTSGHTNFYKKSMFPAMHLTEITDEEKDDYQIKPMNCPFHIFIYKKHIRSYRQLPLRYTELGTVYRYEKSGTLRGLTRVRGFTQDDAHIFCTKEQLEKELVSVLKLTSKILKTFGFRKYKVYLSTRPEKYIGSQGLWEKAENTLKYALNKIKLDYEIQKGEGAFYGPKIDIGLKDSIGREWQCSTIQLDFNLPERFDVSYIDKKGKKQQPIMIHRALLGSLERFIGILIEHYAGAFPLWLAPEQIWVVPISARHQKYAKDINQTLVANGFRSILKNGNQTVSKKIREGELEKIPYILVVGQKEIESKSVRVRKREKGDIGELKMPQFIEKIKKEIEKKR